MKSVRVLLTCIGGCFSPDTIRALKQSRDPEIEIIGVDAGPDVATKHLVESFYTVPPGTEEGYVPEILRICKKEKVKIIIPCADEEVMTISKNKEIFTEEGIICAVDNENTVFLTRDKWKLFEHLSRKNISMPKYKMVHNVENIKDSVDYFEYPKNKFVLKPIISRGARNVWIIGEDSESTSLRDFQYKIAGLKDFEYLAMEYLPGPAYDVDVLAREGNPLCIVPRRRVWKNELSPYCEGCIVEKNMRLTDFVGEIVKSMKLNFAYDLDCGTTADGKPAIYEINPRFSGAIAASSGAGVNIPVMLVKMLMGMEVPKCSIKFGMRMQLNTNGGMQFTYEEKRYADKSKE